ncbi:unannotated protein [freshwater metagenome]|uniref:Unannotated protein n=1 Tax=freshwater metagenome TaxID=449393 RepID=A0A6J7IVC2_9ZZZZ|nr:hypothetical protein [Actinomycetota bacterium]
MTPQVLRLTTLEVLTGAALGTEPGGPPPLLEEPVAVSPRAALEAALLPALKRSPCVITFSGGVDSSLLLAVATRVARREGLPAPVPVTVRFSNAPGTREDEWQERVIADLALDDWVRIEVDEELDLIGQIAAGLLRRLGVVHPPHLALHALLAERVPCRSYITGYGGDQLGYWVGVAPNEHLPRPGRRRSAILAAQRLAPAALGRRALRASAPARQWLRPEAHREYERRWAAARQA